MEMVWVSARMEIRPFPSDLDGPFFLDEFPVGL
jgi:hypothetical protein